MSPPWAKTNTGGSLQRRRFVGRPVRPPPRPPRSTRQRSPGSRSCSRRAPPPAPSRRGSPRVAGLAHAGVDGPLPHRPDRDRELQEPLRLRVERPASPSALTRSHAFRGLGIAHELLVGGGGSARLWCHDGHAPPPRAGPSRRAGRARAPQMVVYRVVGPPACAWIAPTRTRRRRGPTSGQADEEAEHRHEEGLGHPRPTAAGRRRRSWPSRRGR